MSCLGLRLLGLWSDDLRECYSGAFAVSEVPGVLVLSPWLMVSRAGCPGECYLRVAKDEGCQVLHCRAGN